MASHVQRRKNKHPITNNPLRRTTCSGVCKHQRTCILKHKGTCALSASRWHLGPPTGAVVFPSSGGGFFTIPKALHFIFDCSWQYVKCIPTETIAIRFSEDEVFASYGFNQLIPETSKYFEINTWHLIFRGQVSGPKVPSLLNLELNSRLFSAWKIFLGSHFLSSVCPCQECSGR